MTGRERIFGIEAVQLSMANAALEKERELTPCELVTKGRCIQLASEGEGWELEEAANAFKQALEIEPEYVPALIELGFFYFAVEGNASKALPLVEEAVGISRSQLTEAAVGQSGCLEELEDERTAARFLCKLHRSALLEEALDDEKKGWLVFEEATS